MQRLVILVMLAGLNNGCEWSGVEAYRESPAAMEAITAKVVDRAEYDEVLDSLRGKVVLVDFWATWCAPCRASFPDTVRMSRQYGGPAFSVVSVSLDEPDDRGDVVTYLRSQGATFVNLISSYGGSAEAYARFEIEPPGVPHYKLYDAEGRLRHSFVGHSDEIEFRVRELLAERG